MTSIFIIIGAVVTGIITLALYGLIGWVVYEYGVKRVEKIVLWGKKIELGKFGVIILWPGIIAAGILIIAAGLIGQLYTNAKRK